MRNALSVFFAFDEGFEYSATAVPAKQPEYVIKGLLQAVATAILAAALTAAWQRRRKHHDQDGDTTA